MRNAWSLALIVVAVAALAGCASKEKSEPAAASKSGYPLTTCVVSGEALGPHPTTIDYKGREVRFCCPDCVATFEKDPAKYMATLDAASK